jgi:hypothetical protein
MEAELGNEDRRDSHERGQLKQASIYLSIVKNGKKSVQ